MTAKRFTINGKEIIQNKQVWCMAHSEHCADVIATAMNELVEENEQLRSRLKDWHQRTFKAHEYFNILEKVIDEVCNDDISNEIWKEYEKREKLIE